MTQPKHLAILGGGPAGLAAGYYATQHHLPTTIYEANEVTGGNCVTLRHQDFLFDSGAHRLHDKDPEITNEIKKLLGSELTKINVPSQIYYEKQFVDFPLSPVNLLISLGLFTSIKAGVDLVKARIRATSSQRSFEDVATFTYGKTIARQFLLNYSEKLWGAPSHKLSPSISGKRLKGLSLKTFLTEAFLGKSKKTEHLDGTFYYPKLGIGVIPERLEEACGKDNVLCGCKITRIFHDHQKIQSVEINHQQIVEVEDVISTLPITTFLKLLEPQPSEELRQAARNLRYRNLILVTLFLDKPSITQNASVYFPSSEFPFTRVYEPRNRSPYMSPVGKTSLVAEIPCQTSDSLWSLPDQEIIQLTTSKFVDVGWIKAHDVIEGLATRINHAYPILEVGYEENVQLISKYLENFTNLKISGRNGKFMYTHIHDMMRFGKDIIEDYVKKINYTSSS